MDDCLLYCLHSKSTNILLPVVNYSKWEKNDFLLNWEEGDVFEEEGKKE
jgi:hypothetical protein